MSYVVYQETWEDANGYRLNIAFTEYEMKKMPYEYRYEKRKVIFEQHGFNYKNACRIREEEILVKDPEEV